MSNLGGSTRPLPRVSTTNVSTTPIAAGGNFTGTIELNACEAVLVDVITDKKGLLYIDFTLNGGQTWLPYPTLGAKIYAGVNKIHIARKGHRGVRVRVLNTDTTDQTYLYLHTEYGEYNQLTAPLNQSYRLDSDSTLTRPSWTWLDVARGLAVGLSDVKKFGRCKTVGTSFTPVCNGGYYRTPQVSGATALRVKAGGSANDTAAGTGARKIYLIGLDENFGLASDTLITAGASASSPSTVTFIRLFRSYVLESGTYASAGVGSHSAAIVIENAAGTEEWCTIDATNFAKGQSEIGAYTVPAGYTGYVKLRNYSVDSGKTVELIFFAREGADETAAPYSAMRVQSVNTGMIGGSVQPFGTVDVPFGSYVGPTDIGFMARVSSGTAEVSVEFEVILVENL